jgi:ketosteroid isomerase-like protein
VKADGPDAGHATGLAEMAAQWRDFLEVWQDGHPEVDEYLELDGERVLLLFRQHGRGKTSGLDIAATGAKEANLFHVRDGKVTRLVLYLDRGRAFADLGLED